VPRKLHLRRETLTELTTADLSGVAGGRPSEPTPPIHGLTYYCPMLTDGCPTNQCATLTYFC
jgi:hypothetical protein